MSFCSSRILIAIAPERLGVEQEDSPDQLARRVALALDQDPNIKDLETVYLAQQGTAVVFKGKVPTQETLNELIKIAQRVEGATAVATDQVVIGTAILTAGQGVAARCEFWLRKGEGWQVAAATDGRLVTSD